MGKCQVGCDEDSAVTVVVEVAPLDPRDDGVTNLALGVDEQPRHKLVGVQTG